MPGTTALLTLLLVGGTGTSEGEFAALDQPSDLPGRVVAASAGTGNEEGRIGASEERDASSAPPSRRSMGEFAQQPIVRGALIGAILGAVIGLLGGAAVGGILSGVVRSLP